MATTLKNASAIANQNNQEAVADLKTRFGEQISTNPAVREQHGHTLTWIENEPPDAVVFPNSTEDVAEIVKICASHQTPIIPYGAGTSLEGHLNAPMGGVSIDFSKMKKLLAINQEDLDCRVEAGITRKELNSQLRDTGLFFPVDPGANATLGGMAATRASGTNSVRYGTIRENILNLTAVMADGSIVQTARRARKSAAGYDLTHLLIGSEGTLGIITELTLNLHGIPEAAISAICPFKTVEQACNAVIEAIQMGLNPARIELLDELQIKACNVYSKLSLSEQPTLFLEFHGTQASVASEVEIFKEIAEDIGGGPLQWLNEPAEKSGLWAARHDAYWAAFTLRPGANAFVTDVCVPISRLAECVRETQQDIKEIGLIATIVGHVGDGNFHVLALIDMQNKEEVATVEKFVARLVERALRMDGTCTGEHGVGQGKMRYLEKEHGPGLDVMRAIKMALDPLNILNPGKIISSN